MRDVPKLTAPRVTVARVPTDAPESDGTLQWDATTLVLAEIEAGGCTGLGYTYSDPAIGAYIRDTLAQAIAGTSAFDIPAAHRAMQQALRNDGRAGIASMAVSAVDNALWDLKARLLDLSVAQLLGQAQDSVALYGSGGFTSYDDDRLARQLGGWADDGFAFVKMKVGRDPARDPERLRVAREAIGTDCQLFVDANGAFTRKQALAMAEHFAHHNVRWFEEPVSSDDLAGLRLLRDRAPPGMAITAGEYGYDPWYFRRMLQAGAVDVIQADATRCCGITGFLKAARLAEAFHVPISAHCAPALHLHVCAALPDALHLEWFHDHVRIEHMLFDGAPKPSGGRAVPDPARPGFGLEPRRSEIARHAV
ncbi:mandelate racemase [Paracoccus stylophorae]|uniref:Mandelate racemase n=1 Tax=Paracoccus stylophorae TaxID=659350 RepID=A0ABY7SVI1_9RHOB|nr:enolase C-terminal domain-like protein [Paracoccus stylophorae]WCR11039.1 mandelate racemase [Paracoccus stylophorae]